MFRLLARGGVLALLCLNLGAQDSSLHLEYSVEPTYPARRARIQGNVVIRFRIDSSGATTSVEVLSGHPRLAYSAEQAVKTWRFARPPHGFSDEFHNTTFEFSFSPQEPAPTEWHSVPVRTTCVDESPNLPVSIDLTRRPTDFVELSRTDECLAPCPAFRVRIYRSGDVEWRGLRTVAKRGKAKSTVDPQHAAALLDEFSTRDFWSSCSLYSNVIMDGRTDIVKVRVGDKERTVEDYGPSGPPWFRELIAKIEATANTQRWVSPGPTAR